MSIKGGYDKYGINKNDQSCLTCIWREPDDSEGGFVCINENSEFSADWVEDDDHCPFWEGE